MTASKTNLLARCVIHTGSTTAAILLYRICYWTPYAKVERDGKIWIAKERVEWCAETGLTHEQYKDASRMLRRKALIEITQSRFGGKLISFTRLTDRGAKVLKGAPVEDPDDPSGGAKTPLPEWSQMAPPGGSQMAPPIDKGDTLMGDTEWEIPICATSGLADPVPGDFEENTGDLASGNEAGYTTDGKEADHMPKAADYQTYKSSKPKSKTGIPDTPAEMWVKKLGQWRMTQPGISAYVHPLNVGQAKTLDACFAGYPPEGVLDAVINDWPGFVEYARVQAGAFPLPTEQTSHFLVKYIANAIAFSQIGATHVKPEPLPEYKAEPAPEVEKALWVKPAEAKKMTAEELAAMLGDDDA